jgi:hypothetical protein
MKHVACMVGREGSEVKDVTLKKGKRAMTDTEMDFK